MDAEHHAFRFRVAHADVIFNHHRFAFYPDQSEEDEAFVDDVFFFQSVDGRFDDAGTYFFHVFFIGKRNRSHAAHTACVESFVAFTDTLVVFRYGEDFVVFAVGKHEYGTFDTAQELFNNDCCRCGAEHTAKHFLEFFLCLVQCGEDQNAFSGTESVGFQHVWGFQRFEESQTFFEIFCCDTFIPGCRDLMTHHEAFGKLLAALQLCSVGGRTDNGDMFQFGTILEVIVDAFYQRVFGTYYYHFDVFFQSESADRFKVGSFDVDILAYGVCSGVSRSDVQLFNFRTLGNFPCQCMFAATRA